MKRIEGSVRGVMLVGAVTAVLGLAACSGGQAAPAAGGQQPGAVEAPAARLAVTPPTGAVDVPPREPVSVTVTDGKLTSVALTNQAGRTVKGTLSADATSWSVAEPLGYGKTYTWSGSALGGNGEAVPVTGSFTTVRPRGTVHGRLNVGDGRTYGIAMPIAVSFDAAVGDKAAAQRAMAVTTSVPTEGGWAWLDDRTAHWRPKAYWKPGTKVVVAALLYGVALGDGVYGRQDVTSTFAIGRAQVVKADTRTHRVQVFRGGRKTADFPASFGLESDPGRVTKSGIHVVMAKHTSYSMSNPRYDYENVVVPWAVRISNNGEFVHGYAPSIWAQGRRNISHGCVNLSPANAKRYFDSALVGDPVEITGSTQRLSPADGDYHDWALTWDKWLTMSA